MSKKSHLKIIIFIVLTIILIQSITIPSFSSSSEFKEKYAVIVIGRYAGKLQDALPEKFQQYYRWYHNSAGRLYTTLKEKYGFTDENIILLASIREKYEIPETMKVVGNWANLDGDTGLPIDDFFGRKFNI